MKNILVLYFFCAFLSGIALCQEDIEIDSQVISINSDKEYIIIKAGENEGIEIGDGLIIHRDAEKLAEAQVVEVRANVAAAEILNIEKEIKEGDSILIVKKAKKYPIKKEKSAYRELKKSKWTTLLGSGAAVKSAVPVKNVTSSSMTGSEFSSEALNPEKIQVTQGSSVVRADIDAGVDTVFSYSLMVLRENGYSVIFSSRTTGAILATMPIRLDLIKELWADATASIEHKLVVSLEMKNSGGAAELNIASFKEHTQKGKQIKFPVTRESAYYNLLVELASKIKERAEH
ncbi:MAG: hypothetical protein A2047_04600 [Omnitrophica bacterium GWA2_41_15]|nr:MAG: hypothetical protein A2047_04600 [Omnitrophica bacterium GWA2_41_15]HAZ10052.1 hypothetical protein [Candidatus Omnitrophota bacterium]